MQHGGNRRLKEFLKKYEIDLGEERKIDKYKTRACRFYRDMLKAEVEETDPLQPDFSEAEGREIIEPKLNLKSNYQFKNIFRDLLRIWK